MRYAFADGDLAARRLRLVAEVFAGTTTAFVAANVRHAPALALDLGCGPGHTTHLLARVTGARRTVGVDSSEPFVAAASRTATEAVSFVRHDVTEVPFPVGPANLAYCRFLLTHRPAPERALDGWASALAPSGLVLVDEVERIETSNRDFAEYLAIVDELVSRAGGMLYVGPRLEALGDVGPLRKRTSAVACLPVADRRAAAMFALNIATWGDDPDVRARHGEGGLARLGAALRAIAEGPDDTSTITWGLRQIVFERS